MTSHPTSYSRITITTRGFFDWCHYPLQWCPIQILFKHSIVWNILLRILFITTRFIYAIIFSLLYWFNCPTCWKLKITAFQWYRFIACTVNVSMLFFTSNNSASSFSSCCLRIKFSFSSHSYRTDMLIFESIPWDHFTAAGNFIRHYTSNQTFI